MLTYSVIIFLLSSPLVDGTLDLLLSLFRGGAGYAGCCPSSGSPYYYGGRGYGQQLPYAAGYGGYSSGYANGYYSVVAQPTYVGQLPEQQQQQQPQIVYIQPSVAVQPDIYVQQPTTVNSCATATDISTNRRSRAVSFGAASGGSSACEQYQCYNKEMDCGIDGYYLDYGLRYCRRFEADRDKFDADGQAWIDCTRECLLKYIRENKPFGSCSQLKEYAFASHPRCYLECHFCEMSTRNMPGLFSVFQFRDFFGKWGSWNVIDDVTEAWDSGSRSIKQVYNTLKYCDPELSDLKDYFWSFVG